MEAPEQPEPQVDYLLIDLVYHVLNENFERKYAELLKGQLGVLIKKNFTAHPHYFKLPKLSTPIALLQPPVLQCFLTGLPILQIVVANLNHDWHLKEVLQLSVQDLHLGLLILLNLFELI